MVATVRPHPQRGSSSTRSRTTRPEGHTDVWESHEDARSDFILAIGAFVIIEQIHTWLTFVPGFPDPSDNLIGLTLFLITLLVATAGMPLYLARYRGQGAKAFGLDVDRTGINLGVMVGLPVVMASVLAAFGNQVPFTNALLGRFSQAIGNPVIGSNAVDQFTQWYALAGQVLAAIAGGVLLVPFLVTKARNGFRHRVEITLVEGLRTFGMGAAVVAAVTGALLPVTNPEFFSLAPSLLPAIALAAMVLLVDRSITLGPTLGRAILLAPAILLIVVRFSLGSLGSNLFFTIYSMALTFGVIIVFGVLIESRRHAWAVVPLAIMTAIWTTYLGSGIYASLLTPT